MIRRLRDRHRRLVPVMALLTALVVAWALLGHSRGEPLLPPSAWPSR
jgi:hypothetical protein